MTDERTRRGVIGLASGSAVLGLLVRGADADGRPRATVVDEAPVLFKRKDVTVERVDCDARTVDLRLGPGDRAVRLTGLPVREEVSALRVSHVFSGVVNNPPFDGDRLAAQTGRRVSVMLRAGASRLSVESIATAND